MNVFSVSMKCYLPYKTFDLGSPYSAAYNSDNPVNESNCLQFALGGKMPVRAIVLCICIKSYQIKIFEKINNLYSLVYKYNVCNMK